MPLDLPYKATWMGLGGFVLNEIIQAEKEKYYMIPLIGGIKKTHRRRVHMFNRGRRWKEGECRKVIKRYTFPSVR